MIVKMFQPPFARLVLKDRKRQMIWPWPKNLRLFPKRGQKISLREWMGKPYRSRQRVLREAHVSYVATVRMTRNTITVAGWYRLTKAGHEPLRNELARLDGFRDWEEMRDWFATTYGLPFRGVLIRWLPSCRVWPKLEK